MTRDISRHSVLGNGHSRFAGVRTGAARLGVGAAIAGLLAVAACTRGQLDSGQAPSYAVVDQISAAAGVKPTQFAGTLAADVLTYVKKNIDNAQVCVPTVFEDPGRVIMHMQMKDPGSLADPNLPSQANTITFTRYHIKYTRTDGRNVEGVDVPYGFDGGISMAIVGGNVSIGQLIIVRSLSKAESPLRALVGTGPGGTIATIAEVTFYGTDTAGRSVIAKGNIEVDFADWGDPDC